MRCNLQAIGGTMGQAKTILTPLPWAARYDSWLLMKLTLRHSLFFWVSVSTTQPHLNSSDSSISSQYGGPTL